MKKWPRNDDGMEDGGVKEPTKAKSRKILSFSLMFRKSSRKGKPRKIPTSRHS